MRRIAFVGLTMLLLALTSCGSSESTAITCTSNNSSCTDPVTGITLTISPATASIGVEAMTPTQFVGAIAGGTNNVVVWKVNGITGGNQTLGTIDSNGDYLSPDAVPNPATLTIQAYSFEDPNLSAEAAVTILPLPTVTITPTTYSLPAGTQETFSASVTNAASSNVIWLVNNVVGGNATYGEISANGVYTAPASPPVGGVVTVTAESQAVTQAVANATVTITGFSQGSLNGPYAFSMSGKIGSPAAAFFRAGSFKADGAGNLSGGLEDIHTGSSVTTISFSGTYTVGLDGRGTMQFSDGQQPGTFSFVMVNSGQFQIIGFDNSGVASGQGNSQTISSFNQGGVSGTYAFDFTGQDDSAAPLSQVGQFTADGVGDLNSGLMDASDNGTLTSDSPFTGTYLVNSNGRGTASVGGLQFAFYVVSRGSARFVEIDSRVQGLAGYTTQQAPNNTFSVASFSGTFAFLLNGAGTSGPIATAGSFTTDGTGDIISGQIGGELDENVNGTVSPTASITSGSYAFTGGTGRGTATFTAGSRTYMVVFYMGSSGTAVMQLAQETTGGQPVDPQTVSDGFLGAVQDISFSNGSLQGNYALETVGTSGGSPQVLTGRLLINGSGAVPSGALDINTAGTVTQGETAAGSYSIAGTGRGTLTLNPSSDNRNFAIYVLSSSEAIVLGIDAGRLAAGTLQLQF